MAKETAIQNVNNWIKENGFEKKFCLLEWAGLSSRKSKFKDLIRDVEFLSEFSIFKRNLKRNPNCIFSPTKEEFNQKVKELNLEKYGVDHPSKLDSIKEQVKETNLKKYGTDNPMKLDSIKNKLKTSLEKKYGVNHFSKTEVFKEKIRESYNNKTDEEKTEIINKREASIKSKFGESGLSNSEISKKKRQTNLKKYGVENPRQNIEILKKIEETNLKKYGEKQIFKVEDIKRKIKRTKIEKGTYKEYRQKGVEAWAEEIGFSRTHFNKLINDYGFEKAIKLTPQESSLESSIRMILEKNNINFLHNRNLEEYRPDFLLPENNIVIECDGLYWHSDQVILDKDYHKKKKEKYEELGYDSLFFREDEIKNKKSIIESMILNKCKKSKRFFARKCEIKKIDENISKKFFEENHLMGNGTGRTYGLFFEEELICCIQVRWQNKKERLLDISRFSSKLNTIVVGGFTKLIEEVKKKESPFKIQTFIDKRYGKGDYLQKLGWSRDTLYTSFSWTNGKNIMHRMKHPGNSGYDFGLAKIWDCGQAKYVITL